jgi:SAM-dependent MidA family methyltransferase
MPVRFDGWVRGWQECGVNEGSEQATRWAESSPAVVGLLRHEIETMGRITFARFMEVALAHPEHGYYMTGTPRTGFTGDFLTGPETHPIFGFALARQIAECWERLGRPAEFTVREFGAGSGTLALDILAGLREELPAALAAMRYEVSDANPARVSEAQARAIEAGFGAHLAPATSGPVTGVLLANELLDAFPVHRLIWRDGTLQELYVGWRDGWFTDEPGPLSDARLAAPVEGLPLADGQQLEVSLAAQEWAQQLGRQLAPGYAILIDYGYPAAELFDPAARLNGTLRTYSAHMVGTDPYRRVGTQDLTAHVDFTAIATAAESGGCAVLGLTSQAYFFAGLGIEELLLRLQQTAVSANDYLAARETIMHLLEPRGLGRFRVLVLGKQVPPEPLRGLSFSLS